MPEALFNIGGELRRHFQALERLLSVSLSAVEIDRMFKDAEVDQVTQKSYCFHQSKSLSVIGVVDDYEPETIWIRVEGDRTLQREFRKYVTDGRLMKPHGPL